MEQNREPRNKLAPLWPINIWQTGKNIQWGKGSLLNKWCRENWTDICKKMKLDHLLTPHPRINSKWIKDFNGRPKTIKLLGEHTGTNSLTPLLVILFWVCVLGQGKEKKTNGTTTNYKVFTQWRYTNNMKRQSTEWENMFANGKSDKGSISKTRKKLIQLNTHTHSSSVKQRAEGLTRHFMQMAKGRMKGAQSHSWSEKCKLKPQRNVTLHLSEWPSQINEKQSAGKAVEKGEPPCAVGGNADWSSCYRPRGVPHLGGADCHRV